MVIVAEKVADIGVVDAGGQGADTRGRAYVHRPGHDPLSHTPEG